eukprot:scaffold4329_cov76-Skeletonema_dohrnii-CCMP3373.AAC.2
MADEYYIFTGGVVPRHVTRVRIDEFITVIPARAFEGQRNITELDCHIGVKIVREFAFNECPSLRRVIMPGVKVVVAGAFWDCKALTYVECGKLEIIRSGAFSRCESLRSIDLPSIEIVHYRAFIDCKALTNVKFGKALEIIEEGAFMNCPSLERITIPLPLKDGMITHDNIFQGCENLKHVDLVGGVHEIIAALLLEDWRNDMSEEIDSINQILPTTPAGNVYSRENVGGKAREVRLWIRSVLHKIIQYKAQHQSYLNEAATILQLALPNDIIIKNVLPFLELPSYTFEGED